ncbi:FixH family protein [Mechercharimyces sp. CAU 1602]|uniref:FixH family protein n=1 Tax=Mechercharimyces sp. CAU 1602 TaxID=2973933 RepID=UPI0021615D5F|nr:FixH family protein [Mechercharimyces sp. CAU 1602]MCS1350992.1 FixH family protein [Mechercharimyces sp. CAU 1602]
MNRKRWILSAVTGLALIVGLTACGNAEEEKKDSAGEHAEHGGSEEGTEEGEHGEKGTDGEKGNADKDSSKEEDKSDEGSSTEDKTKEGLAVAFTVDPEVIKKGEAAMMIANVQYKDKPVTKADKVEFEVWKESEGKEKSEKIPAQHTDGGMYMASKEFTKTGKYNIIYHVTAEGSHSMKQVSVEVK